MRSINFHAIETRVFNQPMSFEVCGFIDAEGEIFLTEIYAVGQDSLGNAKLECVDSLLNVPEIRAAIISLLNEVEHGLIFNGSK